MHLVSDTGKNILYILPLLVLQGSYHFFHSDFLVIIILFLVSSIVLSYYEVILEFGLNLIEVKF